MTISVRSFAKINLGLRIGALRADGFHELRTVYQTIGLHDVIRVSVARGSGIEIRCEDPRVPKDSTNTCYRIVERTMEALKARGRVVIEIEKKLPIQGGLGGASGNAVSAMWALERVLKRPLLGPERLRIASAVGSDLPLFLIGGTVLGVGRGEEVYPLPDFPSTACVTATPEVSVSTPEAFSEWDRLYREYRSLLPVLRRNLKNVRQRFYGSKSRVSPEEAKLTEMLGSDRISELGRVFASWLSGSKRASSGVSSRTRGGRAENLLLDLVRTGIKNDFEEVVFPIHPELCEVKRMLERAGAAYASLSGSGSAIYGLFESREKALAAAKRLEKQGTRAVVTSTLTRRQYWRKLLAASY